MSNKKKATRAAKESKPAEPAEPPRPQTTPPGKVRRREGDGSMYGVRALRKMLGASNEMSLDRLADTAVAKIRELERQHAQSGDNAAVDAQSKSAAAEL